MKEVMTRCSAFLWQVLMNSDSKQKSPLPFNEFFKSSMNDDVPKSKHQRIVHQVEQRIAFAAKLQSYFSMRKMKYLCRLLSHFPKLFSQPLLRFLRALSFLCSRSSFHSFYFNLLKAPRLRIYRINPKYTYKTSSKCCSLRIAVKTL